MMELWNVIGAGICALSIVLLLRELRKEWALYVIVAFGVLVFFFVMQKLKDILPWIDTLCTEKFGEYVVILCKALGIVWLTHIACELCKTAGESVLANYMELAGRIELTTLSIPLWKNLLELALSFL